MMMKALQAGGLPAYYSDIKEAMLTEAHDKATNPNGYFEPAEGEVDDIYFPNKEANDKVVKVLSPWLYLGNLTVMEYKIVIMLRDPREIAVSLARLYKGALRPHDSHLLNRYSHYMQKGLDIAANRKDCKSLMALNYSHVLAQPLESFELLQKEGWPIDAKAAADTIDPALNRVKFNGKHDVEPVKQLLREMPADKKKVNYAPV